MKLHLPIAILTAVFCVMNAGAKDLVLDNEEPEETINTDTTLSSVRATGEGERIINKEAECTLEFAGNVSADSGATLGMTQSGGTIKFTGGEGTEATFSALCDMDKGELVHSGSGKVTFHGLNLGSGGGLALPGMASNPTYHNITQTGTGTMVLEQYVASESYQYSLLNQSDTTVKQTGGGTIINEGTMRPNATVNLNLVATDGSRFENLGTMQGSGTINLDYSEKSTFVNRGTVTAGEVSVSDSTLTLAGGSFTVTDSLSLTGSTVHFELDSLDSTSGISMAEGATVALSDLLISVTYDAELNIDDMLSGDTPAEFSFVLIDGLASESAVSDLLSSFTVDMLTMNAYNAQGALQNLDVQSAEMTYAENGVVTISGTFSASAAVPEPTTATLSLLALAGLAARRRRK